jgi:16S rRNA (uracil1498-N3)-methyltransferase
MLIGPEGGWTDEERSQFEKSWTAVSLGPLILRAETAALAALAVLNAAWTI